MNNVSKTISWCQWTINPVKGLCPVGCSYCYARRMYGRDCNKVFKDKTIRYDPSVFLDLRKAKPGDRIFVGSTIDLFHPLCSTWNDNIIDICRRNPEYTFMFLTKCPQYLPKEWPDNCWVGVSVTDQQSYEKALRGLSYIGAKVRFMSFEPLLKPVDILGADFKGLLHLVIIGLQTPYSKKTAPRIEWVKEIVEAADKAKIPVFLKNSLKPLIDKEYPDPDDLSCDHNRLLRTPPLHLCKDCDSLKLSDCPPCGVIWKLRQELPKEGIR